MSALFHHRLHIPADANDANGHVNNVTYVQWMQDVATLHSDSLGCDLAFYRQLGAGWVVRAHRITYLKPAFAGEEIELLTWISSFARSRSQRRYCFRRPADDSILARAETDWVYVDINSGRPRSIDAAVLDAFTLLPPEEEP